MAGETPKMTSKIQLSAKPSVHSSQENRSQVLVNNINPKDGLKQTQGNISNGNNSNKSEKRTVNEEATPSSISKAATSNYTLPLIFFHLL